MIKFFHVNYLVFIILNYFFIQVLKRTGKNKDFQKGADQGNFLNKVYLNNTSMSKNVIARKTNR